MSSASRTSLRQAVPKAQPDQATSSPIPSTPPYHTNDPLAPFNDFLHGLGRQSLSDGETQETPQQERRRLLQAAKSKSIDQSWGFTGMLTAEMRAAARLAIDRELRDEPLEEFSPQEVIELAEGVRDRGYNSFLRRQEKDARRIQNEAERHRANQRDDDRKHTERTKRKSAYLDEARRRVVSFLKTRSLSTLKRLEALEEVLSLLDQTLTGDEPLSEAFAAIDTMLQVRVAQWDADEAAREARQQEEWMEIAVVILGTIALGLMYVKVPEILLWLLNSFWPEPPRNSEATDKPTGEAACPPSDQQPPLRRIRRIRRPPQSPPPEQPL